MDSIRKRTLTAALLFAAASPALAGDGNVKKLTLWLASPKSENSVDALVSRLTAGGGYIQFVNSREGVIHLRVPHTKESITALLKGWTIGRSESDFRNEEERVARLRASLSSKNEHLKQLTKLFKEADFSQTLEVERQYLKAIAEREALMRDLKSLEDETGYLFLTIHLESERYPRDSTPQGMQFYWMTNRGVPEIYASFN